MFYLCLFPKNYICVHLVILDWFSCTKISSKIHHIHPSPAPPNVSPFWLYHVLLEAPASDPFRCFGGHVETPRPRCFDRGKWRKLSHAQILQGIGIFTLFMYHKFNPYVNIRYIRAHGMGIGEQLWQNPNMTFHQDPDWFMTGSLCRDTLYSQRMCRHLLSG